MNRFTRIASLALLMGAAGAANAVAISLQPGSEGKDTQLVSGTGAGTNYGSYQYVIDNWSGNNRAIGLLEFDLSSIGTATVNSASLDLYHVFNNTPGSTYNIFRVTSAWDEGTASFNNAPTIDSTAVSSLTLGDGSGVFRSWDITSLVSGWVSGAFANYGLWIEEVPIQGSAIAYFASSDHSNAAFRPRLNVDYSPTTAVPEPAMLTLFGLGLALFGLARRKIKA